ncbi:hypothetical protein NQ318_005451 [Aromia moschata]|uniref:Uncharacterized protein n=1 Tax=Aromia moschata TaxID=1265417 RepID=A0AAV8YX11_9CUCU|nr:hypothetical protein NQ318_005451 [Aromia moschata]
MDHPIYLFGIDLPINRRFQVHIINLQPPRRAGFLHKRYYERNVTPPHTLRLPDSLVYGMWYECPEVYFLIQSRPTEISDPKEEP